MVVEQIEAPCGNMDYPESGEGVCYGTRGTQDATKVFVCGVEGIVLQGFDVKKIT